MAFLALNTQREYYIQQQSSLEYRQLCASSNLNLVTQKIAAFAATSGSTEAPPAQLKALQDMYTSQTKMLDTQITQVKENIKSFEKAVGDNIKSSCKFNFLG